MDTGQIMLGAKILIGKWMSYLYEVKTAACDLVSSGGFVISCLDCLKLVFFFKRKLSKRTEHTAPVFARE